MNTMFAALGAQVSGVDYVAAIEDLQAWSRRVAAWWVDHDLLVVPTSPEPPVRLGELAPANPDPAVVARMGRLATFTAPFDVTGQPAMSLPLHWNADGLADRRATGRRLRTRGRAAARRRAARAGAPVGRAAPADPRVSGTAGARALLVDHRAEPGDHDDEARPRGRRPFARGAPAEDRGRPCAGCRAPGCPAGCEPPCAGPRPARPRVGGRARTRWRRTAPRPTRRAPRAALRRRSCRTPVTATIVREGTGTVRELRRSE